jgi:DNA-binding transcriptional ArsR family regulator
MPCDGGPGGLPQSMEQSLLMEHLDDQALERLADYFRALSVTARLKILSALSDGERKVGELTDLTGCSQANVSKHLALLTQAGLVQRTSRGTSAYYRIADPGTYKLCDLVCVQIGKRYAEQAHLQRMFSGAGGADKQARRRRGKTVADRP